MNMNRFIAPRIAGAASLLMLAAQARAVTPEPENLPTVGPMGGIIFGVIFVGFCVVVVWMMMKQKGPEQDQDKE
jgi:hypothetical protein